MNYFNLPLSSYSSFFLHICLPGICRVVQNVQLYYSILFLICSIRKVFCTAFLSLPAFPPRSPCLPLLHPLPLLVCVKGETKEYVWLCCHPSDPTACIWTWFGNHPRCYKPEEILSEIRKLEERWGRHAKQGRSGLTYWIASLPGLVSLTNCYL